MIVQVVKYKTGLSDGEAAQTIAKRAPQYEALPGLRQKLYIKEQGTGEYGGIYIWDDEDSMRQFRKSDLAATIPEAYRVEGSRGLRSSKSSRSFGPSRPSHQRIKPPGRTPAKGLTGRRSPFQAVAPLSRGSRTLSKSGLKRI
jgi:heme-degrading monooxygenase HmoA